MSVTSDTLGTGTLSVKNAKLQLIRTKIQAGRSQHKKKSEGEEKIKLDECQEAKTVRIQCNDRHSFIRKKKKSQSSRELEDTEIAQKASHFALPRT